jgi:hypothetical protein
MFKYSLILHSLLLMMIVLLIIPTAEVGKSIRSLGEYLSQNLKKYLLPSHYYFERANLKKKSQSQSRKLCVIF